MLKTAFQLSTGAWFLEKTAFLKKLIFSAIWIWSESCLKFLRCFFRQLRENCNPCVHRNNLKKYCSFFDRYQLFSFTDFNRCNFEHSKKTILTVLSIRHSTYPEERLDEISFLQRIRIVQTFLDFELKISWIPAGNLCHKCRKCSCVYRLRFPAFFFVEIVQFFLSFLCFDWFSFIFGWIFLGMVCKTALYVPQDLFEEKQLLLDFFPILQPFPDLKGNFSVLWRKLCGSLVKSALFPPVEQNEGTFVLKKCIIF